MTHRSLLFGAFMLAATMATESVNRCRADEPIDGSRRAAIEDVRIGWAGTGKYRLLVEVSPVTLRME